MASTLLDQSSCTVTVDGVKPDEWVKVCLLVPRNLASYAGTLRTCHTIFLVKEHCVMSAKNVSVGGYSVHIPLDVYIAFSSQWAVLFLVGPLGRFNFMNMCLTVTTTEGFAYQLILAQN